MIDLVGKEFAGFRITEKLGEGASAVVFRGENLVEPDIVRAIKVIRPELAAKPEFLSRFKKEAITLDRLQHPNVVRFYGIRMGEGLVAMELELLRGQPVDQLIARGARIRPDQAIGLVAAAAAGTASAHALRMVHRDLKPENLFLTAEGELKVLDFGLARALDDAGRADRATVAGTVAGTAAYLAPEVCNGAEASASSDVYALALTLYELLVGYHPLRPPGQPAPSLPQLMMRQIQWELPPVSSLVPGVPAGLDAVLAKGLAKDPAQRYADGQAFSRALHALTGQGPAPVPGTVFNLPHLEAEPVPRARPARPTATTGGANPWARVLGCLGLVTAVGSGAAILAAGLWFGQRAPPPAEASAEPAPVDANPFVRVETVEARYGQDPILLGVRSNDAPESTKGFRPRGRHEAPKVAYEIHRFEVSWAQFDPWRAERLASNAPADGVADALREMKPPAWLAAIPAAKRGEYPVAAVPWIVAMEYCQDLHPDGGSLPTEAQFEFAARGADRRPYPWGTEALDKTRTAAHRAPGALPQPSTARGNQDCTPGAAGQQICNLVSNVAEWTADKWQADSPDEDVSWVERPGMPVRAVRGLPLVSSDPVPAEGAAYRVARCGGGTCEQGLEETDVFETIGFRCARPASEEP